MTETGRSKRTEAGLTLIEVLLAMVILGVALLGVAGIFPTAYENISSGGQITRATFLAEQQLEILRGQGFGALGVSASPYGDPANPIDGIYTRQWWIQDSTLDAAIPNGMKRIRVRVSWAEPSRPGDLTLATLVAP